MSSTYRVLFLTFNSLSALSKVCSSRHFSASLSNFSIFFSTATERLDFPIPNNYSSPIEHSSYDTPNPLAYQQNHNGWDINPSQGLGEHPMNDQVGTPPGESSFKYTGGLHSTGNQWGTVGQNGTFGNRETSGNLQMISLNGNYDNGSWRGTEQSSTGFHQNHTGMYWESTRNSNMQINSAYSYGNFSANGANAQNVTNSQHQGGSYFNQHQQNPQDLYNANHYGQGTNNPYYHGQVTTDIDSYGQVTNNSNSYAQVATTSNFVGESTEVLETSSNNTTIEMLDEFCKEGHVKKAVEVLGLMEKEGVNVDYPRILQLMKACGEAKALQEAKTVHEHLIRSFSPLKISAFNKILEMYSRCGSVDDAFEVFDKMPMRNLTSWDTMITWLAKNGLGEEALDLFSQFKKAGLKPDAKMFIGVFSACGVVDDIKEGMLHFESMSSEYGIVPSMEHYVGVVDMMGSTGHLDEALEFIDKMPFKPGVDVWETLMNLCRVHGYLELGDRCAELVEQLDPFRLNEQSKSGLILLKDSDLTKQNEKKKLAIPSPLEVRSRVHEYRAGDTSHPENDRIYALLRNLKEHMKEAGYLPETRFVLHDIDQESKEEALLAHSERLALANGLLTTPARGQIRIIKNLRVCGDCHAAFKIMSKIVGREIIMRDAKRFHHFNNGVCSCRDYW